MRRFCIIACFISIVLDYVGAQNSTQPFSSSYEVQKIPANPDVAQLGKFGDVPVNKYNGTANITVPIYVIDFEGLQIPISLKYNTSGIRVEQESSWVGLGWSLSDGMTITREINGYEDIYNFDHFSARSVGWIYSRDFMYPDSGDGFALPGGLSEDDLNELQDSLRDHKPIDTEPDFFTVNLPSGSCKFTLPKIQNEDTLLTALVSDNMNYIVIYDRVNYKFEITDPNGFVYQFDEIEMSTGFGSYESNDNYSKSMVIRGIQFPTFHSRHLITSWRVSKITSPLKRELNFTYSNGFYFSYPHFSESVSDILTHQPMFLDQRNYSVPSSPAMFANMTAFEVKNLTLISGDFGSVEFVLSDRSDLVSKRDKLSMSGLDPDGAWNTYLVNGDSLVAKKVDQVIVRNSQDEIIRTADLTFDYFNSQWVGVEADSAYNSVDPLECDVSYIRLKLIQVTIGDQKYKFDYHQPDALPRKDSKSVDFWGFNNGKNNTTMIPSFNRFYVNHPGGTLNDEWHEYFIKLNGGNRGADINYGRIGILEKVTYPTGGYTVFNYEGHQVTLSGTNYSPTSVVSDGSGQLRFTNLTSSTDYKYSYQYLKLAKTPEYSLYDYNTCSVSNSSFQPNDNFHLNTTSFCNGQTFNVRINATINCSVGCGQGNPTGNAVWIQNINTSQEYIIYTHNNEISRTLETTVTLPAGTYQLKAANWTQGSPTVVVTTTASASVFIAEDPLPVEDEKFDVGGARLQSMTHYSSSGSIATKFNYHYDQYVLDSGQQVSNGKLMDELIFHSKAQNLFDYTAIDFLENTNGSGAVVGSDSKIRTNASAGGSHIGYSLVREEQVDDVGSQLGQVVTQFSNKANELILKPTEILPRIIGGNSLNLNDFHSTIYDLTAMGVIYYPVSYGSVYILGARPISHEYSNGSVLNEKIYDQLNNLLKETIHTYNNVEIVPYAEGGVGYESAYPIVYFFANSIVKFQTYFKVLRKTYGLNRSTQLTSTTTIDYLNSAQLVTTRYRHFDNPDHHLLTREATMDSEGILYTTKYSYPKDLPTVPFMSDLVNSNQVSAPIIVERYKGSLADPFEALLEKVQTFYSNTNSVMADVLPSEVRTYVSGESGGQQRVLYEQYSNYGTLVQYRKNSEDRPVSLLWGYNKQLPIAKILDAEATQTAFTSFDEPAITDGGWNWSSGSLTTEDAKTGSKSLSNDGTISKSNLPTGDYLIGFWAKVINGSSGSVTINGTPIAINGTGWNYYQTSRNANSVTVSNSNVYLDEVRLHPIQAQMTSYTYKPLVGMTSQTDPNGNVTTFEYDSTGRLVLIRDHDGNILGEYKYHYQDQE